jgi:steroid 5-alpha reductase family enzyme
MIVLYLEALAAIAVALFVLMAGVWVVQHRTGDSGWVGTPRKLFIFLQNQGFGSIPLPPRKGVVT